MLEVRSAYGWYGEAGGVTGENVPPQRARVPYREYKTKWKGHRAVDGTYDPETKTIEVYFTDEEMKQKTNLGNRYGIATYYFLVEVPEGKGKNGWASGMYVLSFRAKNEANAERNARKWARGLEYTVIREATLDEYIHRNDYRKE